MRVAASGLKMMGRKAPNSHPRVAEVLLESAQRHADSLGMLTSWYTEQAAKKRRWRASDILQDCQASLCGPRTERDTPTMAPQAYDSVRAYTPP
jgi:hypothetical protein